MGSLKEVAQKRKELREDSRINNVSKLEVSQSGQKEKNGFSNLYVYSLKEDQRVCCYRQGRM